MALHGLVPWRGQQKFHRNDSDCALISVTPHFARLVEVIFFMICTVDQGPADISEIWEPSQNFSSLEGEMKQVAYYSALPYNNNSSGLPGT